MRIMIRQDNHHNHPRHDQSQSKTIIPLPSDTFHDKLFPIDQRDVLINSIVLLVQVLPRFWHSSGSSSQSNTIIPLPSDTFHDKLFPIDQRDVLINSIVLLVQVVPRFWHSSGSSRRNTFDAPLRSLTECRPVLMLIPS